MAGLRLLQIVECPVPIARYRKRESGPCHLLRLVEGLECQIVKSFRVPAPRSRCRSKFFQLVYCIHEVACRGVQLRQFVMGWPESRITFQGLMKLCESLRGTMRIHQGGRMIRTH